MKKICIFVPERGINGFISEFISWCSRHEFLEISYIVIVPNNLRTKEIHETFIENLRKLFFRLLINFELTILKRISFYRSLLTFSKISTVLNEYNIEEIPFNSAFLDARLHGSTGNEKYNFDLIVNFTSNNLDESFSKKATLGNFSIGEVGLVNLESESWQGSFWSVYRRIDSSKFEIVYHNNHFSEILVSGRIRTRLFAALNNICLMEKKITYLKFILNSFSDDKVFKKIVIDEIDELAINAVKLGTIFVYIIGVIKLLFYKLFKNLIGYKEIWNVAYVFSTWPNLELRLGKKIINRPGHYLADPFVISKGNSTYCFVEEYSFKHKKGWISVYELSEFSSKFIGVVLEEPFHLSYPYVFEFDGVFYMLPETSTVGQIRLYKCDVFPQKWSLFKVLMSDVNAADTMIFEHSDRWWMFTNIDPNVTGDNCSELSIYYSDSPLSTEWKSHPLNPIYVNSDRSRNGGIIRKDGRIFRVSQRHGYDDMERALL